MIDVERESKYFRYKLYSGQMYSHDFVGCPTTGRCDDCVGYFTIIMLTI